MGFIARYNLLYENVKITYYIEMRKTNYLSLLFTALSLSFGACSTDELESQSTGTISLQVSPAIGFTARSTRAADLGAYSNTSNYNLVITEAASGTEVYNGLISELTGEKNQFPVGNYNVTTSFGENTTATQGNFFVAGTTSFTVAEQDLVAETPIAVSVTCVPQCARVSVAFGSKMEQYFSDYYVTYTTSALSAQQSNAVWTKNNADAWYLKVNEDEEITATIHVVRASDNKWTEVVKSGKLSSGQAWTLNIDAQESDDPTSPDVPDFPTVSVGTVGLVITIDENTNAHEETIVVPDEWWM